MIKCDFCVIPWYDENGKLCGDIDFESVAPKCSFISPVPKGVGVLTVASLVYKMGENVE